MIKIIKHNILVQAAMVVIAACFLFSCRHEPIKVPCDIRDTLSFKADIVPILNTYCNIEGCHSGTDPEASLNLEEKFAYEELFRKGEIDTINPRYSVLYATINSIQPPMPPTGRLDDCTIETILKWIEQGAKKN